MTFIIFNPSRHNDPNTTVFTASIKSEVLLNFIDKTLNKKKFYNFNPYKKKESAR